MRAWIDQGTSPVGDHCVARSTCDDHRLKITVRLASIAGMAIARSSPSTSAAASARWPVLAGVRHQT
jgi:hypothetical protein